MEFYQDNLNLESVGSGTGHTRKPLATRQKHRLKKNNT